MLITAMLILYWGCLWLGDSDSLKVWVKFENTCFLDQGQHIFSRKAAECMTHTKSGHEFYCADSGMIPKLTPCAEKFSQTGVSTLTQVQCKFGFSPVFVDNHPKRSLFTILSFVLGFFTGDVDHCKLWFSEHSSEVWEYMLNFQFTDNNHIFSQKTAVWLSLNPDMNFTELTHEWHQN